MPSWGLTGDMLLTVHVTCALLSYAAFLAAGIAGALFLIQERQLKHKQMGALFYRLPSLDALDQANYVAIAVGFLLFTAGLLFGMVSVHREFGRWWTGDPKEYLTVAMWLSYCVLLIVRLRSTLRGRRVALLSLLGVSLLLTLVVGLSHVMSSSHPFVA